MQSSDTKKVEFNSSAESISMMIANAEKKGRTRAEVDEVTGWLTGYVHAYEVLNKIVV